MNTRRDKLANVTPDTASTNAGLWLDKYIKSAAAAEQEKKQLVDDIARIKMPDVYPMAFARWEKTLRSEEAAGRARVIEAKVIGRLAIGRGKGVLEASIALHHTYGVPYIPGSALKGTAANFARNHLGEEGWNRDGEGSEAYRVLFGEQEEAGYVTFCDSLLKPELVNGQPKAALHADVLTPHHKDYYEGKDSPPADWDSPVPVPFLSATGTYLLALVAPEGCAEWLDRALAILKLALGEEGIGVGAKTSSGYGRLCVTT